jgi:hypothetical protein
MAATKYKEEAEVWDFIQGSIKSWGESHCYELDLAGIYARNPTAHKWQVTYLCWVFREGIQWRIHSLISQSFKMANERMVLGSMIILRSAIETLSALIYVNRKTSDLIAGTLSFEDFQKVVAQLHLGDTSREDAKHKPIRVMKMIKLAEETHEGILDLYDQLCQVVHPNLEGVAIGFSKADWDKFETRFGDFVEEKFGYDHMRPIGTTIKIFETEYNEVWTKNMVALEKWLVDNDAVLEAARKAKMAAATS